MTEGDAGYQFYKDLASRWPLILPPIEYAEEAAEVARLLGSAPGTVPQVLELGSGGGHNAVHLKARFAMTLVDLSEDMLRVSRQLNPDCEHHRGDMRTVRLGRTFDAVFVHIAVDYMTSEANLRQAIETAYTHCGPSGVACSSRTPPPKRSHPLRRQRRRGRAGSALPGWTWNLNRAANTVLTEYVFVLREADGSMHVAHETHRTGLFPGTSGCGS